MENNINNYYGENIEEMGKKVWNQHEIKFRIWSSLKRFFVSDDLFDNETRTELLKIDMLDFYMRVSS